MKPLIILLLTATLALLWGCNSTSARVGEEEIPLNEEKVGQTEGGETSKTASNDPIQAIKDQFSLIESRLEKLKKIEKEYQSEPFGGMLTAWEQNAKVVKLVDEIYDDHGPMTISYYFDQEKLFFLYTHSEFVPMTEKPTTHVREDRYYFQDGRLIRHLLKENTFKFGQKVDMGAIPNKEIEFSEEEAETEGQEFASQARQALDLFEISD
ncbi:MAG: hypothetical protein H6581_17005 [Bacteroidia bacterium]|nr:hypothetical protein [Bacteroidia bacterium]